MPKARSRIVVLTSNHSVNPIDVGAADGTQLPESDSPKDWWRAPECIRLAPVPLATRVALPRRYSCRTCVEKTAAGSPKCVASSLRAAACGDVAQANVVQVTTELILAAIDLHRLHKLSFWDALIVRSARAAGCSIVFSENMRHSQSYDGVVIENPFSR